MKNKIILFYLFCFFHLSSFSQKHINRYKNLERQGLWIVYQDSTNKQIDNIGRYKKGTPKGTWKYFDKNGNLLKQERHVFNRIYTRYYYPNGKLYKKGKAKMVSTKALVHYYYYGNWLVHDTTGELIKKQVYEDGNKISEVCYKTSAQKNINDSLVEVIKNLDQQFNLYNDSLRIAEQNSGKSSKQYDRYRSLNNLNSLKVLSDIDNIIQKFGYPGKTLVGNQSPIIFSIISNFTIQYKEKYYDVITSAADEGELDWSDVAFFVDKVKVAKKEKQLYGTQFVIKENNILYYPIEDKGLLNERRIKKGLEEMDISGINDSADY
jgi:hypothetical protein